MANGEATIAVIGCGHWSTEAHLPALAGDPRARLIAVVDPDPDARRVARERFGAEHDFASVDELLGAVRPDGAIVAAPAALHAPLSIELLAAGAHVLVEKPMALDAASGRAMLKAAEDAGVSLSVGYPWHYNEQSLRVREEVAGGRIGKLELVTCLFGSTLREYYRGNPEAYSSVLEYESVPRGETYADPALAGGGQGQNQVTHAAALLLFLTGLHPATVAAQCESFELELDLVDAISVRFEGGAVGTLASTGGVVPGHDNLLEYRLFGREGHVTFDVIAGRATFHGADGAVEEISELPLQLRYPQLEPARNLVGTIVEGQPSGSPAQLGLEVVAVLEAMYRSSDSGGQAIAATT